MSTIDDVTAKITADSSGYTAAVNSMQQNTQNATDKASSAFSSLGQSLKSIGGILDATVTVPLTALGYEAVSAFNQATQGAAAMQAQIVSNGDACGFTSQQLVAMDAHLAQISNKGQEDILSEVTNSLLKFGNISEQVFADAQQDAVGWAAVSGKSMSEAAEMIGRALANPATAERTLREAGITLLDTQKNSINAFMKQGDVMGAQGVVLGLLNAKYKDSAAAMANLPMTRISGDMSKMKEDMAPIGGIVEKAMVPLLDLGVKIANAFKNASPSMQVFITACLALVAAIGPILTGVGFLIGVLGPLKTGFTILMEVFTPLKTLVNELGVTFEFLASASIPEIIAALAPVVVTIGVVIAAIGALIIAGQMIYDHWSQIKSWAISIWGDIKSTIASVINWITSTSGYKAILALGEDIIHGWNELKSTASSVWGWIKDTIVNAVEGFTSVLMKIPGMATLFNAVKTATQDVGNVAVTVGNGIGTAWNATTKVVGETFAHLETEAKGVWTGIGTASAKTSKDTVAQWNEAWATMVGLWKKGTQEIVPEWISQMQEMKTLGETAFNSIKTAANSMGTGITDVLTTGTADWQQILGKALQQMLNSFVQWGIDAMLTAQNVAKAINFVFANPLIAVVAIAGLIAAVSALKMPAMAMGGIVSSPTTALIGEAGPEAVLPVVRLSNGQMGVQTTSANPSSGGGGASSMNSVGGGVNTNSPTFVTQVYLDSKPILNAVSKASRTGKVVIHPNSVKRLSVNRG